MTFDLDIVTLTFKILPLLYLKNLKVWEGYTWYGHWLGSVGVHCHGLTLVSP